MRRIMTSAYEVAARYLGVAEVAGLDSNPAILAMLKLDGSQVPDGDETPWCSAFVNWVCHQLALPRSRSLAARSWLTVGHPVAFESAERGLDVVVLARGGAGQPGPEVLIAPGHCGFFVEGDEDYVVVLGGNQGDRVSTERYPRSRVLGVRRLAEGVSNVPALGASDK